MGADQVAPAGPAPGSSATPLQRPDDDVLRFADWWHIDARRGVQHLVVILICCVAAYTILGARLGLFDRLLVISSLLLCALVGKLLLIAPLGAFLRWFDTASVLIAVTQTLAPALAFHLCQTQGDFCALREDWQSFDAALQASVGFVWVIVMRQSLPVAVLAGLVRSLCFSLLVLPHMDSDDLVTGAASFYVPVLIFCPLLASHHCSAARATFALLQQLDQSSYQAQMMEINRAVFQRWIFHEIRVPMNGIMLGVDNIAAEHPDDECAEEVRRSCAQVSRVLNTMLLQTQIEEGSFVINRRWFPLLDLLGPLKEEMEDAFARKGVGFSWSGGEFDVFGDAPRLQFVLRTLLSNALKFTSRGEVGVCVSYDTARSTVVATVRDTGIGISPDGVAHLFEPYHQIDTENDLKDVVSTGLHVVISYHIVRAHGGDMRCESTPGMGTTFTIELPQAGADAVTRTALVVKAPSALVVTVDDARFAEVEDLLATASVAVCHRASVEMVQAALSKPDLVLVNDEAAVRHLRTSGVTAPVLDLSRFESGQGLDKQLVLTAARAALRRAPDSASSTDTPTMDHALRLQDVDGRLTALLQGKRVLVVEDSMPSWKMLDRLLRRLGVAQCEHAANGQIAVDLCRERDQAFDLVLMDKEMPVMDGVECTRTLRAMGVTTQIFGLTGSALDLEVFHRAGLDAVLTKPLQKNALIDVLTPVMSERTLSPLQVCTVTNEDDGDALRGEEEEKLTPLWRQSPSTPKVESRLATLLQGKRVLVVEDSLPSWKMLNRFLRRLGVAECEHAANGQIAVDICGQRPFDLVLMDKEMPVMDGVECTRALRAMGLRSRIVGLTGSALDIAAFKTSGLDAVLTKPLDSFALAEVLRAPVQRLGDQGVYSTDAMPSSGELRLPLLVRPSRSRMGSGVGNGNSVGSSLHSGLRSVLRGSSGNNSIRSAQVSYAESSTSAPVSPVLPAPFVLPGAV